jgi:hypothetical protein
MQSAQGNENRKYIRHAVEIPIEVSLNEAAPFETEHLKDVSLGGLCFKSRNFLDTGRVINIKISITKRIFEAEGKVVWCKPCTDFFEIGVEFTKDQDVFRARMVEQVCYIIQYKKKVLEEEGRTLTNGDAAMEWIKKYAEEFEA